MRCAILPEGPIGSLPFADLAALALRSHIYLQTLHGEEAFAQRLGPWRLLFEAEVATRGGDDATVLPVLVRATEDQHDLGRTAAGPDLVWLLAAYSVRSGAKP